MKLLIEEATEVKYITEGEDKKLFIEGIFMQCLPNRNKRIYKEEVLHNEVKRYMKEVVNAGRGYGELGHPNGPGINLDKVCHIIKELRIDGKNVYGKAEVATELPNGKIVAGLIKHGANLGVSSRGLGSLKPTDNGLMEVQNDFKLITGADVVADPSAPDAFVKGIMEDREYFLDEKTGMYVQKDIEQIAEKMDKMSIREIHENKLRFFEHIIKNLSKTN